MLNILDWWRGRTILGRTATDIYGSIVASARNPVFYTDFQVPDVAEKRYEMIVLHLLIVMERLRERTEAGNEISQALVEAFVRDLDGSMREMAVGDTSVPAKVKKAAAGLLDRNVLYRAAFESEPNLKQAVPKVGDVPSDGSGSGQDLTRPGLIDEMVYGGKGNALAESMLSYVEASRVALKDWDPKAAPVVPFPAPDRYIN